VTALSCSAPIELNTSTDNQMRSDVFDALLHHETQRRPQESRIEKARPLTWIKGAAERRHHDPVLPLAGILETFDCNWAVLLIAS